MRETVEKSRNTVFCQCFAAPEGQKSGFAKTAGAEPSGGMRDQNPDVARNTFRSQNVQSTSASDRFWKLCGWLWRKRFWTLTG